MVFHGGLPFPFALYVSSSAKEVYAFGSIICTLLLEEGEIAQIV